MNLSLLMFFFYIGENVCQLSLPSFLPCIYSHSLWWFGVLGFGSVSRSLCSILFIHFVFIYCYLMRILGIRVFSNASLAMDFVFGPAQSRRNASEPFSVQQYIDVCLEIWLSFLFCHFFILCSWSQGDFRLKILMLFPPPLVGRKLIDCGCTSGKM